MAKKLTPELRQVIRDEFIHGYTDEQGERQYPSVDLLAKRHEVARATLYRWVDKEGMLQKVATRMRRGFDDEQANPQHGGLQVETIRELSQIAINAQKIGKLALGQAQEISKVSADISNPEAFREVMEQLDEIATVRSSRYKHTVQ